MLKLGIRAERRFGAVEVKTAEGKGCMNTMTWKYVKPLKQPNAVADFENRAGVSLPEDLKECILRCNGGRPSSRFYDIKGSRNKEFKSLLSYNVDDLETVYKRYPVESRYKNLVPFASDPAGNLLVLKDGEVCFWNHEKDTIVLVAKSYSEFLQMLHN